MERLLLQKRSDNLSIALKVKAELEKINDVSIKKAKSLTALTMVMECDGLIRNEIFKNLVETSRLYRYIIKNPKLKIDDTVFEIKCEKEKMKNFKSKEIIGLYIGIAISDERHQETSYWCNIA